MNLGRIKFIVLFLVLLTVTNVDSGTTLEKLLLEERYTTGKSIAEDDEHDDKYTCFIQNEHIVISFFKLNRYHVTGFGFDYYYEAVYMNIVPVVDVYDVMIVIHIYGSPEIPRGIAVNNIRVFWWSGKKDPDDTIKADDYDLDDSKGEEYFPGMNTQYRIQILYRLTSGAEYRNVVYFMSEDNTSTSLQRLTLGYAGTNGEITFTEYFGNDTVAERTTWNGTDPPDTTPKQRLTLDNVFGVILMIYIGSFLIQIGMAIWIKFQNVGAEFGAVIVVLMGMGFIGIAISMAAGVVSSMIDGLNVVKDTAGSLYDSTIGQIPGL